MYLCATSVRNRRIVKLIDFVKFLGVGRIAVIAMMVGKMLMLVSICDSAFGNIGWDEGKTHLMLMTDWLN